MRLLHLGLSNVTEPVSKMEAIAGNLVHVQEVARQLEAVRRASMRNRPMLPPPLGRVF
jgi:hypothetical protein